MIDNTSNCQHGTRAHRTVACTDPRIVWSPYNWLDVPKGRSTPLVGAYINVTFTGDVVGIGVDASYLDPTDATPEALVVSARVDGTEPQRQSFADMHNDALVWSGLGPGMHTARITLAMNSHFATRWNGSPPSGLTVTGVVIAGELLDMDADQRNAPRALFYGDSITEGNNIEEFGTFGDNSFAVTAMDELGVQFGLHAHSLLMWQHDFLAQAGPFVDIETDEYQPHVNWMNIAYGQSMLTNARPYRYREGAPEIVLSHIGVNDIAIAFGNKFGHRPSTAYLADAIAAWLGQVRAVCGPTSHIVLVEPLAYQHIYPHLTGDSEKIDAVKAQYGKGIADYRAAHPDDHRIHHVVLGKNAAEAALSHNGVPYPSSSIQFRPDASRVIGQELAGQLKIILAGGHTE